MTGWEGSQSRLPKPQLAVSAEAEEPLAVAVGRARRPQYRAAKAKGTAALLKLSRSRAALRDMWWVLLS